MRDFKSMKVWEKGHALTLAVYRATQSFPSEERYGLVSQMRRSASSIPANIAEGCGRVGDPELARFCQLSFGSATELEYWLLLSRDLGYVDTQRYAAIVESTIEVKRMLGSLLSTLRGRDYKLTG
jgi:four helix bundle protein